MMQEHHHKCGKSQLTIAALDQGADGDWGHCPARLRADNGLDGEHNRAAGPSRVMSLWTDNAVSVIQT